MQNTILIIAIIAPVVFACISLLLPKKIKYAKEGVVLGATLVNLVITCCLFKHEAYFTAPWAGFGFEFSLRLYHFSGFIILSSAFFAFLVALYSVAFLIGKDNAKSFYLYLLLTVAFVNGSVLADNLIVMLFFWEGLLVTLFGMIFIGNNMAFKTATKALIITGVCDLCMMVGIALSGHLAGTLTISKMAIPLTGLGGVAFILLMIGAISKGGSMPFHSWIPDAALDAPLPFMAILPAAIDKLVGIYFLSRICLDMFQLQTSSWVSPVLMIVGALTILLAVMMALIQKNFKRLLSYHAISQVGYMILGIGTLVPAGIIGGIFHMINNALYKSCLFLTGGSVEKQTGTTDLVELGGLGRLMPITFGCFIIAALSISGVPPFNGFFSKELVYDGALERGWIFYLAAIGGSFLTAASFLKLGHAAFLGKLQEKNKAVKESPLIMLIPMAIIAVVCILFGIFNSLPIKGLIQPILGEHRLEGHNYSGFPANWLLVAATVVVLLLALANHIWGVKRSGSGLHASDHIRYSPLFSKTYSLAEKRFFDPYNIGIGVVKIFSRLAWGIDKGIDWVYNVLTVSIVNIFSAILAKLHNGNYRVYILWSFAAAILIAIFFIKSV